MKITHISQLLPLVETMPEFVVIDKGDYQVIDYVYQDQHTFDNPDLMECRGIKFDADGFILARPFRKFFNYGERGADMPAHRPHVITEKLDGSMIHPVLLTHRKFFYLHTRKGLTDVSRKAERFVLSANVDYRQFCKMCLLSGWTPIFEYTSPNNRIVLRYEEDDMRLLAMRNTMTGEHRTQADMRAIAEAYQIPVARTYQWDLTGDLAGFVKHTRELQDAEGFVVYFDDGYMVKIKAEDYVLKHRALDDLGSKKKVVALCTQGFMDDVLPILSEADASELIAFHDELQHEIAKLTKVAEGHAWCVTRGEISRKDWALHYAPMIKPQWLAGVCFGVMDGKDARMMMLKAVERGGYEDMPVQWRGQ